MSKIVQRGYVPKDQIEFGDDWKCKMNQAGEELFYLLNRGYSIKSSSVFIGNHYVFSERQRLALARIVSPKTCLEMRKDKELSELELSKTVYIDGFNTIITLEVALSQSLLIRGMDDTIRDLAGLRGTYRIVDKTERAVQLILQTLDELSILNAVIYLDRPVSNSGRLKALICELAKAYRVNVSVEVIDNVDSLLEKSESVISSDAIILDRCKSWFNLNKIIIESYINRPWIFELNFFINKTFTKVK